MWLLFSQLSAIAETSATLLAKKSMANFDSTVVTWFWVTTSLLLLTPLMLWNGIPQLSSTFFVVMFVRITLDTAALLLYTKALHLDDISLVTPLFNFSAIFSLLFSYLINKEAPGVFGLLGIVCIVMGAYFLKFEASQSLWLPIKKILYSRASIFMLISTILYGIIFSISKIGIETSSLSFYTFAAAFGLSITTFPIAFLVNRRDLKKILEPQNALRVLPLGIIDGIKILFLMLTIQTSYVAFADAGNNTSIIYNMVAGKIFFKEQIHKRILPVLLMFLGLILIVAF